MHYVSTRGAAPALDFEGVLLAGLAGDGGLYLPEAWPQLSRAELRALGGLDYAEAAARIMAPFIGDCLVPAELRRLLADSYAGFDHPAVAPLLQIAPADWLLDLTRGPTLAFKDYALQPVGRLFEHVLERRGERLTILGATSGDTGSAAIAACAGRQRLEVFILYPQGRISEVQRRQMTTVGAANVTTVAVEGTFDDCQDIVKALFNDAELRKGRRLAAVNSINWARIMAQIVYFTVAAVAVGAPERSVAFAVPTGNFGNVFAAYAAMRMGVPIERLIVGSNRNDVLTRFFESGTMAPGPVHPTLSPSMDIQISSNFERLLFELEDRDGAAVAAIMERLRRDGQFALPPDRLERAGRIFAAARFEDEEVLAMVASLAAATGITIDPHTAVGLLAARARRPGSAVPVIALATAHPAKFPDAVARATGRRPPVPPRLADLLGRRERASLVVDSAAQLRDRLLERQGEAGS